MNQSCMVYHNKMTLYKNRSSTRIETWNATNSIIWNNSYLNTTINNNMTTHDTTHIPEWWRETTLGEIVTIWRWSSPRPIQDYLSDFGIPWVKISDATASQNRFIEWTKEYIKEEGRSTSVQPGDLIVSNSATPWIPKFMRIHACVHDWWLVFSNYKELNNDYLYYFFLDYRRHLEHSASWTVFKNLTTDIVRHVPILLPPLPEQRAIADILSSLDAKIELLRDQNETLEKTAQTIFQEWFGRYSVESPEELPQGWRVGKVSDFGKIVCGKTPPKDNPDYFGWDIPFIKIPDMHGEVFIVQTEDSLTKEWANSQINKFVPKDSICVSCIATVGLVTVTSQDSQTNQQINSIVPERSYYREYFYLTFMNMKEKLIAIGSGWSATLNINTWVFSNIDIIIPDEQILKKYHEKISPMFEKILSNLFQIQSLSKIRDTLLPRLMSGEVRVV